jgi:hypothetical protein
MDVLPTSGTPGILGYNLQPKMGVANELIAVGWGYAGRRIKSTEMLKLNHFS